MSAKHLARAFVVLAWVAVFVVLALTVPDVAVVLGSVIACFALVIASFRAFS